MSPPKSKITAKTPFSKRLKLLIGNKKISTFERECSISNGKVSQYYNGAEPRMTTLVSICMATGCDANWLLLGKGEPFPDKN
jgi:hypothetical protein